MPNRCLLTSVDAARDNYLVEVADTPALLTEAFQLRHQVYCVERGFETSTTGMESDGFDNFARHVLLRNRMTGQVLGTVRIVLPAPHAGLGLPMQQVCDHSLLSELPLHTVGEVSRFAISKERRASAGEASVFMRLGLIQGMVRVSRDAGLTHWCAIMERSLLRLLQANAIHFQAMGPLVEFHGIRQPVQGCITTIMDRMRREANPAWRYITLDGALWPASMEQRLAA